MIRRLLLLTLFVVSVALPQASRAEQARPVSPSTPQPLAITTAPLATGASDLDQPITITKTTTSFTHTAFTQVAVLTTPRRDHTSTLLPNGQILTVGGRPGDSKTAERFDPVTHQVTSAPSLTYSRIEATATLLPNGEVLVVGGSSATAEIYTPATNRWRLGRATQVARIQHTATLLPNGKVLIVGGRDNSSYTGALATAELYDPATNRFTPTASMRVTRTKHAATRLPNGDVLVVGGDDTYQRMAERYVVATGQWERVALQTMGELAAPLSTGEVLIIGFGNPQIQRYNPTTGNVIAIDHPMAYRLEKLLPVGQDYFLISYEDWGQWQLSNALLYHAPSNTMSPSFSPIIQGASTTVLLPDGRIVALGGETAPSGGTSVTAFISIGSLRPPTHFTATLTVPGVQVGDRIWLTRQDVPVQFQVWADPPLLDRVALGLGYSGSSHSITSNGQVISTTEHIDPFYGDSYSIALSLYEGSSSDPYARTGVVTDLRMAPLGFDAYEPGIQDLYIPASTVSPLAISWRSTPSRSEFSSADLDVRASGTLTWTRLLSKAELSATNIHLPIGSHEIRVRRYDHLGRVSDWVATQPIQITTQSVVPSAIWINGGARATPNLRVTVFVAPHLAMPDAVVMRVSDDGITWDAWQFLAPSFLHTLSAPDGLKNVWIQFRSATGTLSTPVFASIKLDTRMGTQALASINNGALFTNDPLVRVLAGNPLDAYEMQISNDGGFGGAVWQPFDSEPLWRITTYGNFTIPRTVYVRVRGDYGIISNAYSDDIIYDPFAPTGSISVVSQARNAIKIELTASDPDGISGLGGMRVGTPEQFAVAAWEPFDANKTLAVTNTTTLQPIYAQFRDNANNMTPILCVTPAGAPCGLTPRTYLSFIAQ